MSAPWSELLDAWFGDTAKNPAGIRARNEFWFSADKKRDEHLKTRFGSLVEQAANGRLYHWLDEPEGRLALIIALDQLPRNLFRGTPRAFAHDAYTAALCLAAAHTGQDRLLEPTQRAFLYMPLQHFEDLQAQEAGVALYEGLANDTPEWPVFRESFLPFAQLHRDIIARFGRFPHRNEVMKRDSTEEEKEYLRQGAPRFGQ